MKNNLSKFTFKNNFKDYIESSVEYINKKCYKHKFWYLAFYKVKKNDKIIAYFKANNIGIKINKRDRKNPYLRYVDYIIDSRELGIVHDCCIRERNYEMLKIISNLYEKGSSTSISDMEHPSIDIWYEQKKSNEK